MAVSNRMSGLDRVLRNLNREVRGIQNRGKAGLWMAALMIRRRAQQLTPVKTGNLRASAYTHAYNTPKGPGAEIGYTANYAVFVHEIDKDYRVGQWKFLETALKEKARDALEMIRREAQVRRSTTSLVRIFRR